MKLNIKETDKVQPDPFIFDDGDGLYLYVTGNDGVEAYSAKDLLGEWKYEGIVTKFPGCYEYWAPSVIKIGNTYYMYVSCSNENMFQFLHVASSDNPLGPFTNEKCLYNYFSIDSHMVESGGNLFLWYAKDNLESERIGTRVYLDRFIDPYTPENDPKEVIVPTFEEEKFTPNCKDGKNWYTIEGPFWFMEGEWQYVMYSGGCFMDDTYHIGYACAKSSEEDLKKVEFVKKTDNGKFNPVIIKNDFEEGTGHHSVIKYKGEYYAIYHARDYDNENKKEYVEKRTARICRLIVKDGIITAQRYKDSI